MSVNIEELDLTLAEIDEDPSQWQQATWIDGPVDGADLTQPGPPPCGTVMCVAGHTAWRHGWRPDPPDPGGYVSTDVDFWRRLDDDSGQPEFVAHVARDILGLTQREAAALFYWSNSRAALQEIRNALAAGEPVFVPEGAAI